MGEWIKRHAARVAGGPRGCDNIALRNESGITSAEGVCDMSGSIDGIRSRCDEAATTIGVIPSSGPSCEDDRISNLRDAISPVR